MWGGFGFERGVISGFHRRFDYPSLLLDLLLGPPVALCNTMAVERLLKVLWIPRLDTLSEGRN